MGVKPVIDAVSDCIATSSPRPSVPTPRARSMDVSVFASAIWLFVELGAGRDVGGCELRTTALEGIELRFEEELPADQRRAEGGRLPLDHQILVRHSAGALLCGGQRREHEHRCRRDDDGHEPTQRDSRAGLNGVRRFAPC